MRLAVFSDIHSNVFALEAVLADIKATGVDRLVCAGDYFGYYPWATQTFEHLWGIKLVGVIGNHDQLILRILGRRKPPFRNDPRSAQYDSAARNAAQLGPEAQAWLASLPERVSFQVGAWHVDVVHGTPDDPLEGRFYPDNGARFGWFPPAAGILILGHTHYPLIRRVESGGLLLNPGSVGQPRDGDPRPSWLLTELAEEPGTGVEPVVTLRRVDYDRARAIGLLREMGWPQRFIAALEKTSPGPLPVA